jgi:hypothetical protein
LVDRQQLLELLPHQALKERRGECVGRVVRVELFPQSGGEVF